jgi:hypothetical protein
MSDFTWEERFSFVKDNFPEAPDLTNFTNALYALNKEHVRVYSSFMTNIYSSNEPKIIIKIPSTPFQKSKFNENFTFAFQSLITGRKSTFIKLSDREKLGITDNDKIKGGIFPLELDMTNNLDLWQEHFNKMFRLLFEKRNVLLSNYYSIVDAVKGDWWELYNSYLKSEEWKAKREKRLFIDNHECYFHNIKNCSTTNLHVHHIHYDNVGNENLEDLVTVCQDCHSEIHGRRL